MDKIEVLKNEMKLAEELMNENFNVWNETGSEIAKETYLLNKGKYVAFKMSFEILEK